MKFLEAGTSGFYEILLIVLVIVWIFNGLLKNKIMKDELDKRTTQSKPNKKSPPKVKGGEYVDYEEVDN